MKLKRLNLFLALVLYTLIGTNVTLSQDNKSPVFYSFSQIKTDTLFESNQIISIISIPLAHDKSYSLDIVYNQTELKPTSVFAEESKAIAAINASFFDMKIGGSVTYMEVNDSTIALGGPLTNPGSILNGVIRLMKNGSVLLEEKKADSTYINSLAEKAVIGTGPVLLLNSKKFEIPKRTGFTEKRHPRTCMCKTAESLLLITIDGRSETSYGMSLYELQDYLLALRCIDAINLDGGGSTTMWLKDKGVVNYPSDKTGERKVANVILIKPVSN